MCRGLCIALGMTILLATACTTASDIVVRDDGVVTPALRASWQVLPDRDRRLAGRERQAWSLVELATGRRTGPAEKAAAEPLPAVTGSLSLDLDAAWAGAEDDQRLAAGEHVELDGETFRGLSEVDMEAHLVDTALTARGGMLLYDLVRLEGIVGLAVETLVLDLRTPRRQEDDTWAAPGLRTGGRVTLQPSPVASVFGQYTATYGTSTDSTRGAMRLEMAEVGAALQVTRTVGVFGGWRWWDYEEEGAGDSDIDIEVSGPTVGLLLRF